MILNCIQIPTLTLLCSVIIPWFGKYDDAPVICIPMARRAKMLGPVVLNFMSSLRPQLVKEIPTT